MAETTKLIPKRRFKEFKNAEAWEQSKLNEYAVFFRGNGLSRCDITKDGEQECILYGNLYTDYGMIVEKVVYKTSTLLKNPVYSKQGDVLIPASDTTPTGLARATSIEKSGVLLGGDINIIRPYDEINGSCLSLAINANRKELLKLIKGTTVKHIYNSDIKNVYIKFPKSLAEQSKLVSLFKNIDNLITLHHNKLEKIKSMKKAYLYEMFPAVGESVPKRRFKGFSDDWEPCELGELLLNIGTGKSKYIIHEEKSAETPYPILGSRSIIGYDNNYDYTGEFILTARVGENAGKLYRYSGNAKITDNTVFMQSDSLVFNFYLLLHSDLTKLSFGSGQPLIKASELKKLGVVAPKDNEEKNKIANFFSSLDDIITLHQRKLDKLKNLKKAYLYEMFI